MALACALSGMMADGVMLGNDGTLVFDSLQQHHFYYDIHSQCLTPIFLNLSKMGYKYAKDLGRWRVK